MILACAADEDKWEIVLGKEAAEKMTGWRECGGGGVGEDLPTSA